MRSAVSTRQTRPRACVARKLMASGVMWVAAHVRYASGGSVALSTTSAKPPDRIRASASWTAPDIAATLPRAPGRGKALRAPGSRIAEAALEQQIRPDPRDGDHVDAHRALGSRDAERADRRNAVAAEQNRGEEEDQPIGDAGADRLGRHRAAALHEQRGDAARAERADHVREGDAAASRRQEEHLGAAPAERRHARGTRAAGRDDYGALPDHARS